MKKLHFATAVLAGLLTGCSSISSTVDKINPFSSSDKAKPRMAELVAFSSTAMLQKRWEVSVGSAGDSQFTPAVAAGAVFAAGADGGIVRVDQRGAQAWRINAEQPLTGGVGSDGSHVAVGTRKGEVLMFDGTGKALWKAQASAEILAAPAFAGDMVIVRCGDNRINAYAVADGKQLWTYQRPTPALTLRSAAGVTVGDKLAYAGFAGGKLVALSLANGAPMWEATVAQPKGTTELERMVDVSSDPALAGRVVCAAAFQGRVACFDVSSGEPLWTRDISSSRGLTVAQGRVYVSDDTGAVQALDADSGASLWRQNKLFGRQLSQPLAMGKYVVVADVQGVVHLLNKEDGSFAARVETDGSSIASAPQALEDGLVVQTNKGGVYALAADK